MEAMEKKNERKKEESKMRNNRRDVTLGLAQRQQLATQSTQKHTQTFECWFIAHCAKGLGFRRVNPSSIFSSLLLPLSYFQSYKYSIGACARRLDYSINVHLPFYKRI
jgi:hypothetical protein